MKKVTVCYVFSKCELICSVLLSRILSCVLSADFKSGIRWSNRDRKQHEKTDSSLSLFLSTPQLSACYSASVQVCFWLESFVIKTQNIWSNVQICTQDQNYNKIKRLILLQNEQMLHWMRKHTCGSIICVQDCVYPDTRSQSFLYPEALDAEAGKTQPYLAWALSPFLSRSLLQYSLISSSSCHGPSSKNSLPVCQGAKG